MYGITGFVGETPDRENVLTDMMASGAFKRTGRYVDDFAALGSAKACGQPIFNESGDKVLIFYGEIYNSGELRESLIKEGHVFKSDRGPETVMHGYEHWGEKVLGRLRGMFAFVIWDIRAKRLFGARDMFGIKPFYYSDMNGVFLFGSQIKSFLAHPKFDKVFNKEPLGNYLSFQFVPTNETFFKGVFCLDPGSYFVYENGGLKITRYFEPHLTGDNENSFPETVKELEEAVKDSVEAHIKSEEEVCSYLSSGVDSSYLAYLGRVKNTFTVGFAEGKYSEIQEAKEFAKSINAYNTSKVITADEYFAVLSDIQYYMDEPVADPAAVALYFLSALASKTTKAVLSGEGSDELFGGYNIYKEPLEHKGFDRIPFPLRRFLGKFAEYCIPYGVKGRGFLMRHGKTLQERYYSNATNLFTEREARKLLKGDCKPGIQNVTRPLYDKVKGMDPVSQMQYVDMHIWLVRDILLKGDKMGMANSVEVRTPFLDKKVFEAAGTLTLKDKIQGNVTKAALRAAAGRVIRKKTAQKDKLGFPVPIRVWLRQDKYYNIVMDMLTSETAERFFDTGMLAAMLKKHKTGRHPEGRTDYSRKIWTVYIFLLWYERFFGDKSDPFKGYTDQGESDG